MKYITFNGDDTQTYKADYNTANYSEAELESICRVWEEEDADGTEYYIIEGEV